MIKNTAGQKIGAQMVASADGTAFTSTVTVLVTGDAGTQATGTVGSGTCAHEGNGYHTYAPSQAETNYDLAAFTFTGTGAVPQTVQVYTRATAPDVNVTQFGGAAGTFASGRAEVNATHFGGSAGTFSGGRPEVNTSHISGSSPTADNIELAFVDGPRHVRRGTAQAGAAGTITLDSGASAVDDFYNNTLVHIQSGTGAGQARIITDYVGSTKVATVAANWATNPSSDSVFMVYPGGTATADVNVVSMAAGVVTATAIATDAITAAKVASDVTTEIQSGLATASALSTVAGYIDTEVAAILAAVDTEVGAIKTKTDFLPSATAGASGGLFIAGSNAATAVAITGNITGNVSGSVGSVSGAVGSVTGSVGGNVTGSVGSVATGGITAASFASDAITAAKIAADVTTELQSGLATASALSTVAGYLDTEVAAIKAVTDLLPNGGALSSLATAAAATAIEADTQDIQSRLPAALVSGRMSSDAVAVSGSTTTADKLEAHAAAVLRVVVGTGSIATTVVLDPSTGIDGAAPSSTNDVYNGRTIVFTSGTLAGQATAITDYVGSTTTLTVTMLTAGATAGDVAVIV